MTNKKNNNDYEVGYKKPPKHTQFKKGQSGNKKGRPKGTKNLVQHLKSIFDEKISVRDSAGNVRIMSKSEAMLQNLMNNAMAGDPKAITAIINITKSMGLLIEPDKDEFHGGVLIVPHALTKEEWEERYCKPSPDQKDEPT